MPASSSETSIATRLQSVDPVPGPQPSQQTLEIFAPLHDAPPASLIVARDQSYGTDERQKLDLFYESDVAGSRPIFLFVPGGGFTGGDRTLHDGPVHGNIGIWAAQQGWIGAVMSHRLAPRDAWPAGAQDIALAIAWLQANSARLGGDPSRIILSGHSAGAAHAGAYLTQAEFHTGEGPDVACAVLVSGIYNIARFAPVEPISSYYGADQALYPERSGLPYRAMPKVPLMLAVADDEMPMFHEQARDMLAATFDIWGYLPQLLRLKGHNHFSEIFSLNTGYRPELERAIAQFVKDVISA